MAWSRFWARAAPWSEPAFELLEDRCLFAAQPVVTVDGSGDVLIGESTQFTVTFDNVPDAAPGSNVGYAPYVDLILPTKGADGSGPGVTPVEIKDGVTFQGASLQGQPLQAISVEFDAGGNAIHPFARDNTGQLRVVHANDYGAQPGDTLVTLRLPFGSYAPSQPAAAIQVDVGISPLADLNTPLALSAVGGFAFGRDALHNPTADAPLISGTATGSLTPTLFTLEKSSNLVEGETATGPSFPHQYTVTLDVAAGQTIDNLVLRDLLPNGVVVTGATAAGATVQIDPGTVTATFNGSLTGVAGPDATLTIDFYVGETLAPDTPGTPVLDPTTGASRTLENNVVGSADWTPLDTRDAFQTAVVDPAGPENVITAKALAIQKSGTIVGGGNTATPGDVIEWTIRAQVSDYFDLDDLTLADLLSDGQSFDGGFAPTISVQEQGALAFTGVFGAANYEALRGGPTTTVNFRVGDEMVARGLDGVLEGGGGPTAARTEIVIVFRSVVDASYANGEPVIDNDAIANAVTSSADVQPSGNAIGDNSSDVIPITPGQIDGKTVYAINGSTTVPADPLVTSGDVVTFRIRYTLPGQATDDFVLTDFLPLPIFAAAGITFQDRVDGTPPPVNVAWFGPTDTLDTANPIGYGGAPTILIDAASNSISFQYGDMVFSPPGGTIQVDILFSVAVQDQPFGDGLVFNNVVQASEANSSGDVSFGLGAADVVLSQPQLSLEKGIVASTNPDAIFDPATVGPVSFTAPGSAGNRFTGTVSSDLLTTGEFASDVSRVDAGDLVTFAIVVENTGSGRNGAFDVLIRDTLAAGYAIPATAAGLNLRVTDGAGNALAFTGDLFGAGISLTDGAGTGALAPGDPTSGRNIVVITYDVRLIDTVATPNLAIENLASIERYAAVEGGTDFAPNLLPEDRTDSAIATTAGPGIVKEVVQTSLPESSGSTLLIGEEVFYDVTLTLAEGSTANLSLTDTLPNTAGGKLTFLDATLVSVGSNLSFANGPFAPGTQFTGIDSNGDGILDQVTVAFGNAQNNPDNIVDGNDRIVLRIHAVLADLPENNSGDVLTNTAVASFNDGLGAGQTIQATAPITVGVPGPTITKVATGSTTVDAGDIVDYTVTVTNPLVGGVAAPVFDMLVADLISDARLTLVAGSVTVSGSAAAATVVDGNDAGDTVVLVSVPTLAAGEALTIHYRVLVANNVVAGQTLLNTAGQRSDTAPGDVAGERVFFSSDSETLTVAGPALVKTVTATDLADTTAAQGNPDLQDVAFGESVTFTLTATMSEGVTQAVVLLDQLPIGSGLMEVTSAAIAAIGGNLTIGSGAGVGTAAVLTDRNGDGIADTATFTLGNVTNLADGTVNAGDQIVFTVTARLISTPGTSAGVVLTNNGQMNFTTPDGVSSTTAQAAVEVVAPNFAITKTPDVQIADANDDITYTVRVTNTAGGFSAPGYDLLLNDIINDPNLSLVAGSVTLTGPAGSTILEGNTAGDTEVSVAAARLGVGETLVITYRVLVDDLAPSGTQLVNRVDGAADTYPGDVPGERDFTGSAGSVVEVRGPISSKTISATSLTETVSTEFTPTNPDLAIGERVTYRISETIAEGVTTLRIVDSLATGDTALELVGFRLVTVGGNITLPGAPVITQVDTDGDGRADQMTIDFGTIINRPDNVVDENDLLFIEIDAVVVDDARNVAGDVAVNTAEIFVNGSLFATRTANADIVEPEIVISKAASVATGDAGDEVTFTVTLAPSESMTGPAYNLSLTDALGPGLELIAGSVTTSRGTIVQGNGASDTTIQVTGPVLLPTEAAVTITYRARLLDTVENGQTLQNTALLDYDSAPNAEARDYDTSASSQVAVVLRPALDKDIVLTDIPETGTAALDPAITDVANGETIVYRLTVRLGEGTQAVTLTDVMPAGLTFLQIASVNFGSNISGDAPNSGVAVTNVGNTLTFDFGTLINHGDNLDNQADEITIDITARAGGTNPAGTQLQNDATLNVTSTTLPGVPAIVRTASETVEIVTPDPIITKTASIGSGDAGDVITYTIQISQGPDATAPLFYSTLTDPLGPGLALIAGSVTTSIGIVVTGNNGGDTQIVVSNGRAFGPSDAPIIITYQARLTDAVEPGQIVINTANLAGISSPTPNSDTAIYNESDPASVTTVMPVTLTKAVIASSIDQTLAAQFDPANPDAAIGELVTYRVAATLSEGTQHVVITDTIPVGLSIVAVRSSLPGFTPTITIIGQTITADFGNVVNTGNNLIEAFNLGIDIDVLVVDQPSNVAGTVLTNTGDVTISSPTTPGVPNGTETATASSAIDIVEPQLVLDKTTTAGFIAPGDAITWTLTLQHAAGSTSAAFDITIDDLLAGTGMDLVAGTVVVNRGVVLSGNTPGDNTVGIALDLLALGETMTITFQARTSATTPPASEVVNTATGDYDSAPLAGGRPGEVDAQATLPVAPGLAKTVFATDLAETGTGAFDPAVTDLAIGETVTYRITATLPQATANGFSINDLLPPGLEPLSASVISIGAALSGSALQPGDPGTISGQGVSFNFGAVSNAGGTAAIGPEDTIVIEVTARVRDSAENVAGAVLTNVADTVFTIGGRTGQQFASALVEVVEPQLSVTKQVDHPTGDAGDSFTYTVTIAHTSASSGPAFDLVLEDVVPGVLQVVSVSSSVGTATLAGSTVRLTLPEFLPGDAPIVLSYLVRMTDQIEPGQQVPNTATLSFDSAPAGTGRDGSGRASALVTGAFDVTLSKEIVATSIPQTGSEQFDPARPDLAIGETVTYRLTAILSEGTQRLVLVDAMPDGLVPFSAQPVDIGAVIGSAPPTITINGQVVSVDFGTVINPGNNVAGDGRVVIEIQARVADSAGNVAGRVLDNAAAAIVASPSAPGAPGGTLQATAIAAADVVTPLIVVDKTADTQFAGIGQTVTYTVVVSHAPGSTAPAFDVVVDDLLVPGIMVLTPGSVTTSAGTVLLADGTVRIAIPELLLGQSVTIRYTVQITGVPLASSEVVNVASATGVSAPGSVPAGFLRSVGSSDDAVIAISSGGDYPSGSALSRGLLDDYQLSPQAPLPLTPMFSGRGFPGSTLQLTAYDRMSAMMGVATTMVDYGGNWIAQFPYSPQGQGRGALEGLSQSALFRDRADGLGLPGGYGDASRQMSAVSPQPWALSVVYADPTPFVARHIVDAPRLTFDGAFIVHTQFDASSEVAEPVIDPRMESLVWNRYAREFIEMLNRVGSGP